MTNMKYSRLSIEEMTNKKKDLQSEIRSLQWELDRREKSKSLAKQLAAEKKNLIAKYSVNVKLNDGELKQYSFKTKKQRNAFIRNIDVLEWKSYWFDDFQI